MNFQVFKLDLEKAEELEIKSPPSIGSSKKQESSRKTSALLTTPEPLTMWIITNCGKFLKTWEYAGQEATVRTGHGKTDWFQIGKGVCQGCILSPCLFNLNAQYIMRNAGLDGIRIAGRNVNNLRYTDATTLMAENEEELKSLLMKVKEESEKVGLNSTFKKLKSLHTVQSVQFSSVVRSCPTLRDPMNCSTPGLPVHHQLPEFT